jgi:hypothetical protein
MEKGKRNKYMAGIDTMVTSDEEYKLTFYTNDFYEYKAVEEFCRKIIDSRSERRNK